jgi:hypothetical protein
MGDKYSDPFRCQLFQGIPPKFQIWNRDSPALAQFIVGLAFQLAAGLGFADAAPLFTQPKLVDELYTVAIAFGVRRL